MLGACSLLRVISAHTLGGVGDRASLCGVCMFSPSLLGLIPSQKHALILVSIMPPPGQPGRLMEGKGTGWNNVFLPRATSKPGKSPMSGEKKQLGLLMIEGSTRSVRCLPRLAEGEQSPGLLGNWHWVKKWVTKLWDRNYKEKKRITLLLC